MATSSFVIDIPPEKESLIIEVITQLGGTVTVLTKGRNAKKKSVRKKKKMPSAEQ